MFSILILNNVDTSFKTCSHTAVFPSTNNFIKKYRIEKVSGIVSAFEIASCRRHHNVFFLLALVL